MNEPVFPLISAKFPSVEKAQIDIERRQLFLAEGQEWPNLSKLSLKQSKLIELCVEVDRK